jgi:hypothetical protein
MMVRDTLGILVLLASASCAAAPVTPAETPKDRARAANDPAPSSPKDEAKGDVEAGTTSSAASADALAESQGLPDAAVVEPSLPRECSQSGEMCTPEFGFVERLCQKKFPGTAIAMFAKGSPWTRGYVRMEQIEPYNTLGGPNGDSKLVFGEEVIILAHRAPEAGKVQVSGGDTFQVLRWDGTCASLAEHELVTWVPGVPRHAPLAWNYLDNNIQQALLSSDQVSAARKKYRAECRGATMGRQNRACEKAARRLTDSIVVAVRTGIELPTPERLP